MGPMELAGGVVRLEAMSVEHAPGLLAALDDDAVWAYIPCNRPRTVADMREYVEKALGGAKSAGDQPLVMIDVATGREIGTTRYTDIAPSHRSLEIGWTMIAAAFQRTAVNTQVKLMMLTRAFEEMTFPGGRGCVRVQLKCDARNVRSQQAIERIGGTREGVLRKHRILPDGFVRDTVYFSILDTEWPAVRERLCKRVHTGATSL